MSRRHSPSALPDITTNSDGRQRYGARLGSFEGRVTGLGPDVTYTFVCGKIPVSTEVKYFHEFDVENRLTGDSGFLTVSLPLSAGALTSPRQADRCLLLAHRGR